MTDALPWASKQGAMKQDDGAGPGGRLRARRRSRCRRRVTGGRPAGLAPGPAAACAASGRGGQREHRHGNERNADDIDAILD